MNTKTITIDVKADSGSITGYASTWTREPDSYGDVVAKGAFAEHIAQIKEEGRVLPFLFNHNSSDLKSYIGTVVDLEEEDHGLKFTAVFDDTEEGQKARLLASNGRLCKFSFAYDVLDAGEVDLEDGRKANELRKLNIHEVSLVMYPANPDTSVVSVKAGRRNSAKDADAIREAISLLQGVLGELDDIEEDPIESDAKSEEPDTVNDEEQKRKAELLEHANKLLKEVNYDS
jgi:HK97 family phage prohead protease